MSPILCQPRLHTRTLACIFFPDSHKFLLLYLILIVALNILNNLDIEYHSVCLSQANTQRHAYAVIFSPLVIMSLYHNNGNTGKTHIFIASLLDMSFYIPGHVIWAAHTTPV